jgi:hypothetical protein
VKEHQVVGAIAVVPWSRLRRALKPARRTRGAVDERVMENESWRRSARGELAGCLQIPNPTTRRTNPGGAALVKIRMRGACLVGVCGREDEKAGVRCASWREILVKIRTCRLGLRIFIRILEEFLNELSPHFFSLYFFYKFPIF